MKDNIDLLLEKCELCPELDGVNDCEGCHIDERKKAYWKEYKRVFSKESEEE